MLGSFPDAYTATEAIQNVSIEAAFPSVACTQPLPVSSASDDSAAQELATEGTWRDLVELTKPRIVTMILVTTIASAMLGSSVAIQAWQWIALMLGTGAIAASAGAANQIYEYQIDRLMPRTARRPLPTERISMATAMLLCMMTGAMGVALLQPIFGPIPAGVGLLTWVLYVYVYTPMKTKSQWNTTVGAVAGALPVLIGFTATGGSLTSPIGWLLFGVLAAWQYPHFMAIAWLYRRQYGEAGFQMTPNVEPSGRSAGWQAVVGSLVVILCASAMCLNAGIDLAALIAIFLCFLACWPMTKRSWRFLASPDDKTARQLLRSSLLVLPLLLLIVTVRVLYA